MAHAVAPKTIHLSEKEFQKCNETRICWLGNGGAYINSRGMRIMIDPLLEGFDMPMLSESPIRPEEVPSLDIVLITHSDNDHMNIGVCRKLAKICNSFHTTEYVAELLQKKGIPALGHGIGDEIRIGDIRIRMTPADHAWQNDIPGFSERVFQKKDCCGFYITTPDGKIWMPGDSRLLEEQLTQPEPDMILLDFSDSTWHIGLKGAVKLADTYPHATLIPIHWGCVDSEMPEFNGDPEKLRSLISNSQREYVAAPGEMIRLSKNA